MLAINNNKIPKIGMSPGSLVLVGEQKAEQVQISLIHYDDSRCEELENTAVEDILPFRDQTGVTWIHVKGLHQMEVLEGIGRHFNVHPLVLEDILNTRQRPKVEDYDDSLFLVMKSFRADGDIDAIYMEQVSMLIGEQYVISFQESDADLFGPVKKRLKNRMGRIRKRGSDYLAYALMDTLIDYYFSVIETIEEEIESIEENLISTPDQEALELIYQIRREVIFIRKAILPIRDLTSRLERSDSDLVQESTRIYLRDLYDHVIQVTDTIETFREMSAGLLDLYHTSVSNRMNEVMKVLTIISTIFIPLSFIAGVYGMNFKYMPELEFKWGYLIVWCLIIGIGSIMIIFFKKKGWF